MRKKEIEKGSNIAQCIRYSFIGTIIALIICFIMMLIGSISVSRGWISEKSMMQYTLLSCAIGCFAGGIFSATKIKSKTLLVGLLVAVFLFLVQIIIGYITYPELSVGERGIALLLADLAGGALAGIFCGKRRKKKRK